MQTFVLSEAMVEQLLGKMKKNDKPAVVDWVNQTIRVLSDERVNNDRILSNGKPMVYRDILLSLGPTS